MIVLKIRLFLPFLLLIFLLNGTTTFAQEVSSVPIEVGNIQVQKATGAAFGDGWNFFTLGFGDCTPRIVLNELQADGGSALKVETLFVKELLGWKSYSILNLDSEKKKIGGGDTLAFNSNQKFFFNMDQKTCSNPDKERQAQIDKIGQANISNGSFIEKVRDLPIDMWTKLMDLLNQKNNSAPSQNTVNQNQQSFDNLTVSGKLTVNNLGITGTLSQGVLAINGLSQDTNTATINTLSGDLYFQNNSLGGVNFLAGEILIDKDGNLKVQNEIYAKKLNIYSGSDGSSASIGSGLIQAGNTSIIISTTVVDSSSKIFITPSTKTGKQPLLVTQKVSGKFTVSIESPYTSDIAFDWWVVGLK